MSATLIPESGRLRLKASRLRYDFGKAAEQVGGNVDEALEHFNEDTNEYGFEWWHGTRKLTVYVGADTINFIKVWGPDIFTEMQDGFIWNSSEVLPLWEWLRETTATAKEAGE